MTKRSIIKYTAAMFAAIIGGAAALAACIAALLWAVANGLTTVIILYLVAGLLLGTAKALTLA